VYHFGTLILSLRRIYVFTKVKIMLVISSREFRENQKKYFDLIDQKEQVIVQRGKNKSYALVPIDETVKYFSEPEIRERLDRSIEEANKGDLVTVSPEKIAQLLGL
jgi:PHD/YefM family antitoxin component YafN of YafNO toxin-antitoxin module